MALLLLPWLLSLRFRRVVKWPASPIFWVPKVLPHLARLKLYFVVFLVILIKWHEPFRAFEPLFVLIPAVDTFVIVLVFLFFFFECARPDDIIV